jgi:hypothetical protein
MSDIVIRAENLGKKYRLQHQPERQRYTALRAVCCPGVPKHFSADFDLRFQMPAISNLKSAESCACSQTISRQLPTGNRLQTAV